MLYLLSIVAVSLFCTSIRSDDGVDKVILLLKGNSLMNKHCDDSPSMKLSLYSAFCSLSEPELRDVKERITVQQRVFLCKIISKHLDERLTQSVISSNVDSIYEILTLYHKLITITVIPELLYQHILDKFITDIWPHDNILMIYKKQIFLHIERMIPDIEKSKFSSTQQNEYGQRIATYSGVMLKNRYSILIINMNIAMLEKKDFKEMYRNKISEWSKKLDIVTNSATVSEHKQLLQASWFFSHPDGKLFAEGLHVGGNIINFVLLDEKIKKGSIRTD